MAITNYIRPQLTIEQILAETATPAVDRIVPIVIGPQFLLSRYGKETTYSVDFDAAGSTIDYKYYNADNALTSLLSTYTVDLPSVKLYGKNLEAQLAQFTVAGGGFKIESIANSHIIKIQTNVLAGTGTLNSSFLSRPVALGDIVYCYADDSTTSYKKRTVVGFKGVDVAATRGTAGNSAYNPVTDGTADTAVEVTKPTGWTVSATGTLDLNVRGGTVIGTKYAEEFTLTVRTPGAPATATVDITSKSGKYAATAVATVDDGGTGYDITDAELAGLTINLDQGGDELETGQVFTLRVFQAYERLAAGALASGNQIVTAGTYTGTKDTTYLLTVKTGTAASGDTATAAVITITDTAGVDAATEVTVTDAVAFDVGTYGITATIKLSAVTQDNTVTHGGLRAGDVYSVAVTSATQSTVTFDKAILSGPAVDTTTFVDPSVAIKVQFRLGFTGEILATDAADEEAWTADADAITLEAAQALYVSTRSNGNKWVSYVDGVGEIYTSYRAYVPAPSTQDKISINSVTDITDNLGTIDLDNDLAFGANEAFSGVQGAKRVYALRTAGPEVADFTAALRKIEATDMVYALAVLSDDVDVMQAVIAHCEAMSAKTRKNFRRCYVGTNSPGSYAVLTVKANATNYTATIGDYAGENLLLTTADDVDFTLLGLEAGDLVKLTATDDEYEIAEILSENEIVLVTGPAAPIAPAVPFQLWRADTPSSQKDYVIARSEALSSRRCANVWVEDGKRLLGSDTTGTVIPNKYVACEIAGLRCAVLPQQGLTNTEVQSVTDAPSMYVRYSQEELDEIAAAGTFIITQDAESGATFIRHQLTTETSGGSLYYEDSVGVNLDNISFLVKDALQGYIGKKNVTGQTLNEIKNDITTILVDSSKTDVSASYGPALNGYENLLVAVHPTLKDRITIYAKLLMPLPLNNIDVTLEGDVDLSL